MCVLCVQGCTTQTRVFKAGQSVCNALNGLMSVSTWHALITKVLLMHVVITIIIATASIIKLVAVSFWPIVGVITACLM